MNIDVFYVTIIVNWTLSVGAFLNFLIYPKDIRAFLEAHTATKPAGEIRGRSSRITFSQ